MIKAGMYSNLSSEDYHADKQSISRSSIMDFKRSPRHYWAKHINPNRPKREETAALRLGSAFHTAILEPDLFCEKYASEPLKVLLKDVGEERYRYYKNQCEELAKTNKTILTHEEQIKLSEMEMSLFKNKAANELIKNAIYESSYFWEDKESGLMVKCRPDILHENMIVDLKTCEDASHHAIQGAMVKGGYHIQGAMMREAMRVIHGRDIPNFILICVEKTYPYSIAIYPVEEEALDKGRAEYKEILIDMATCIRDNSFEDYEIQTIGLPRWYL